jgi:proteasome assembly chaperone (PAC2) family protein
VGDLETLEAVAALSLTTDDVKDLVDKLSTLSVVTLGPVVASTRLAENEVVGAEELAKRSSADGIHGTGLKIDEDSARNILVARGLYPNLGQRMKIITRICQARSGHTSLK